jgi:transcriptional regulator MraZ
MGQWDRGAVGNFSGTFVNKIDKKLRVSVPAAFRDVLQEEGAKSFYLRPSFVHEAALEGLSPKAMDEARASLKALPEFSVEREALSAALFGDAAHITWDGEGRIGIPENLKNFAGITEEVVFAANGEKFTVWAPAPFAAWRARFTQINRERFGIGPATGAGGAS